jgi:hypothetical protein
MTAEDMIEAYGGGWRPVPPSFLQAVFLIAVILLDVIFLETCGGALSEIKFSEELENEKITKGNAIREEIITSFKDCVFGMVFWISTVCTLALPAKLFSIVDSILILFLILIIIDIKKY